MNDLISRAAAIDALMRKMRPHNNGDGTMTICVMSEGLVRETLNDLPSAQPEIIRCKDCKSLQKWRSEESAKKFGQIYECARSVFLCPKPEDFCSWAERRTDEGD